MIAHRRAASSGSRPPPLLVGVFNVLAQLYQEGASTERCPSRFTTIEHPASSTTFCLSRCLPLDGVGAVRISYVKPSVTADLAASGDGSRFSTGLSRLPVGGPRREGLLSGAALAMADPMGILSGRSG